MKCLLSPLYQFGDHNLGFMGCLWCELNIKCIRFQPTIGRSVLFREENLTSRFKKILKRGESMALDKDQKQFIRAKVKELNSVEKVKNLYNKKCPVDDYANRVAKKILKGG